MRVARSPILNPPFHEMGQRASVFTPQASLSREPRRCAKSRVPSGQNAFHDGPRNVGQAEIPSLEAIGQAFVVNAQEVKQGGMKIIDRDRVSHHLISELIRLAMDRTGFDS